jgi:hypothetical protein
LREAASPEEFVHAKERSMKPVSRWVFAAATAVCVIASTAFTAGRADDEGSPIYGVKPVDEAQHKTCFPCHDDNAKGHDFVFTHYAP